MRKLASVQKIVNQTPIEGKDRIVLSQVLGWSVITGKDMKVGDLVIYIECDSLLPDLEIFADIKKRTNLRIKTMKMAGVISQGICFPLSILPKGNYTEGQDVTEIIGVTKYDPEGDAERKAFEEQQKKEQNKIKKFLMRNSFLRRLILPKKEKNHWPEFITKTDEDRIQLFPSICEQLKNKLLQITEKLDGQSATYFPIKQKKWFGLLTDYKFGVCSRNIYKPKYDGSNHWQIAISKQVESKLKKMIGNSDWIYIQGEITGHSQNGSGKNLYQQKELDFYVFNLVYSEMKMNPEETKQRVEYFGLQSVPVLETQFTIKDTIQEMVEYAKGESTIYPTKREGIVVRDSNNTVSFKVINPDFLLEHGI